MKNKSVIYACVLALIVSIACQSQEVSLDKVSQALPTELFEALGGKDILVNLPKEVSFNQPLFNYPNQEVTEESKKAIISLEIDEIDLESQNEKCDQHLRKVPIVTIGMTPKVKKGHEKIMMVFADKQLFMTGAFDETYTDFIYGSPRLLLPSEIEKLKKVQADCQELLDKLMQSLKK